MKSGILKKKEGWGRVDEKRPVRACREDEVQASFLYLSTGYAAFSLNVRTFLLRDWRLNGQRKKRWEKWKIKSVSKHWLAQGLEWAVSSHLWNTYRMVTVAQPSTPKVGSRWLEERERISFQVLLLEMSVSPCLSSLLLSSLPPPLCILTSF